MRAAKYVCSRGPAGPGVPINYYEDIQSRCSVIFFKLYFFQAVLKSTSIIVNVAFIGHHWTLLISTW